MLNEHHFDESTTQKNGHKYTWKELVDSGKVVQCIVCEKWIDKNWFKAKGFKNYPDMKYCQKHLPEELWNL